MNLKINLTYVNKPGEKRLGRYDLMVLKVLAVHDSYLFDNIESVLYEKPLTNGRPLKDMDEKYEYAYDVLIPIIDNIATNKIIENYSSMVKAVKDSYMRTITAHELDRGLAALYAKEEDLFEYIAKYMYYFYKLKYSRGKVLTIFEAPQLLADEKED